jgi:hypothetical protein
MSEPAPETPQDPDDLVVSTAEVARRAGLTLTEANHPVLVDAIRDATDDVVGYLGRAIVPTSYTESGLFPIGDEWDLIPLDDPVRSVDTVTAETYTDGTPTGYFTVVYTAGLDARSDPDLRPILRYVRAHAMNSPEVTRLWQQTSGAKGEVRSVSADGQSISYGPATLGGGGQAGSGAPGALPTLASLDRWRVAGRRVYQRKTQSYAGDWPYRSLDPYQVIGGYPR